jgi:hypothetical protein
MKNRREIMYNSNCEYTVKVDMWVYKCMTQQEYAIYSYREPKTTSETVFWILFCFFWIFFFIWIFSIIENWISSKL